LFGIELDRRSSTEGWGIISNISGPGLTPTHLLAARPQVGRAAFSRLRGEDDAARVWRISEDITGDPYPIAVSAAHPKGDR
jgi:hypothetical protein